MTAIGIGISQAFGSAAGAGGATVPDAPANLTATAVSGSQIDLEWDASAGATGYKIERSDGDDQNFVQIDTVGEVEAYEDTGLGGGIYYYRIRATNEAGDSAYSNIANIATMLANLVGYWAFEDNGLDSHGDFDLSNSGTAVFDTGKIARATNVAFSVSRFWSHVDHVDLRGGNRDFTITAWVRLASKPLSNTGIVTKWDGGARGYRLGWDNTVDRFELLIFDSGGLTIGEVAADNFGAPALDTWYFIRAWHSVADSSIYIQVNNGTPNSVALSGTPAAWTAPFRIGAFGTTNRFSGLIDEVGFWLRNLSDAEATEIYNNGNGLTYPFDPVGAATSPYGTVYAENLGGSWWSVPRSAEIGGKVFFCGVDVDGIIRGGYWSPTAQTARELGRFEDDDHNTPCVLASAGKPVIFFYARHNADDRLRLRRAATVGDIDLMGEQAIMMGGTVTYAQAYRVGETDNIIVFTRVGDLAWYYVTSDDYGATWAAPVALFVGGDFKIYIATAQVGDVVRVALYGHPAGDELHEIYYCEINISTGAVSKVDGTAIGTLGIDTPFEAADMDLVYDPGESFGIRLFDVSVRNGAAEIVFGRWTNDDDMRYRYVYWNGSTWQEEDIVAAGAVFWPEGNANHYNGGCSFPNPTTGGVVYVSREAAGAWYIERHETADNGANWTATELASSSTDKLIRPFAILNAVTHEVTFYAGSYGAYYDEMDTDLVAV